MFGYVITIMPASCITKQHDSVGRSIQNICWHHNRRTYIVSFLVRFRCFLRLKKKNSSELSLDETEEHSVMLKQNTPQAMKHSYTSHQGPVILHPIFTDNGTMLLTIAPSPIRSNSFDVYIPQYSHYVSWWNILQPRIIRPIPLGRQWWPVIASTYYIWYSSPKSNIYYHIKKRTLILPIFAYCKPYPGYRSRLICSTFKSSHSQWYLWYSLTFFSRFFFRRFPMNINSFLCAL